MNFLTHPLFLLLVGVALFIEALYTPDTQVVASLVAGGLVGYSVARIISKDY